MSLVRNSFVEEPVTAHDWPEDFSHENGNYCCVCCSCGIDFVGHKRRVICKACSQPRSRLKLYAIVAAIVLLLLFPLLCLASNPRAEAAVAVSVSRVRAAQQNHLEQPNDFAKSGTVIDLATVSALEYANLELKSENTDLHAENKYLYDELKALKNGAGAVPKQEATTDGNAGAIPPRQQPKADWTRPPVLSLDAPFPGRYNVTVYSATWCGPCESAKRRDGDGDDEISLSWVYQRPPSGIPETYPTYCWRDKSGDLRFIQGTRTLGKLLSVIERNNPPSRATNPAVSAVGGQMETHGQIRAAMQQWRDKLGDGTTVSGRFDKTGDQKLSVTRLMHGEPWTAKQVCGRFGRVELSTTAKLPLQKAAFTYRLDDNGQFTIDPEPLTFGLPSQQGFGSSGEAVGMDPVTLGLTIVQIANALYQILNPQIDVILPGTMSFTATVDGEKLTVAFTNAPSIHVSAWFQFDLEVQSVTITPTNVHVEFNQQKQARHWIKITSRDFPVDDQ